MEKLKSATRASLVEEGFNFVAPLPHPEFFN
jgi:hypothetical protein